MTHERLVLAPLFRKLLRNWTTLISGNAVAQLLSLAGFVVTARAVEAPVLGALAIIVAYVHLIDGLFSFQSVVSVTKFGADLLVAGRRDAFRGVVKCAVLVDLAAAGLATLVGVLGLLLFASLIGLSEEMVPLGLLYCTATLTNVLGMPRAVLRLFDRYGLTVMRDVAVFGLRLAFVVMLYFWDAPDQSFIVAWLAAEVAGNLGLVFIAFRELHRHHFRQILGADAWAVVRTLPGFWTTMWSTNLIGGIRIASQEGDVLLVGAILGPTAAGTFKVAKSLASLLGQVANAVQQSVFPDIARLWAEGRVAEFRTFGRQVNWLAGGVGLLCLAAAWPIAAPLVRLTAGDEYLGAASVFVAQVAVQVIALFGVTFLPMATSLGKMPDLLKIHAVATAFFFAVVPVLLPSVGVMGAALGHILYMVVWWLAAHLSIQSGLRTAGSAEVGSGASRPEGAV